jgi:hypothetical protein
MGDEVLCPSLPQAVHRPVQKLGGSGELGCAVLPGRQSQAEVGAAQGEVIEGTAEERVQIFSMLQRLLRPLSVLRGRYSAL